MLICLMDFNNSFNWIKNGNWKINLFFNSFYSWISNEFLFFENFFQHEISFDWEMREFSFIKKKKIWLIFSENSQNQQKSPHFWDFSKTFQRNGCQLQFVTISPTIFNILPHQLGSVNWLAFYPENNLVSTIRIFNLKCPKSQALNDFLQANPKSTLSCIRGQTVVWEKLIKGESEF
jgi:hypothetical protein